MKYTYLNVVDNASIRHYIYRVDEQGNKEEYINNGTPILYTYGMWGKIVTAGTKNPGLQELIDKTIMYYQLLNKE